MLDQHVQRASRLVAGRLRTPCTVATVQAGAGGVEARGPRPPPGSKRRAVAACVPASLACAAASRGARPRGGPTRPMRAASGRQTLCGL